MQHQFGQPFRICRIRLAPRHFLDVLGINQHYLKTFFQKVEHWLPIVRSALQRHLLDCPLPEPVVQPQQISCHRSKCLRFPFHPFVLGYSHPTGHHRLLMDIQPRHPLIDHSHLVAPIVWFTAGQIPLSRNSPLRAQGNNRCFSGVSGSVSLSGSQHQRLFDLRPAVASILPPPAPIFILVALPQAVSVSLNNGGAHQGVK